MCIYKKFGLFIFMEYYYIISKGGDKSPIVIYIFEVGELLIPTIVIEIEGF